MSNVYLCNTEALSNVRFNSHQDMFDMCTVSTSLPVSRQTHFKWFSVTLIYPSPFKLLATQWAGEGGVIVFRGVVLMEAVVPCAYSFGRIERARCAIWSVAAMGIFCARSAHPKTINHELAWLAGCLAAWACTCNN